MTPAEVLAGARDVLAERGWTQGTAEAADGSVCLDGALCVASTGSPHRGTVEGDAGASRALSAVAGERGYVAFNDDPERTYEDVMLALKRAEELALEQAS